MNKQTRRNFLKTSLYAGTTVAWTAKSWAQVKGANETLRCATIGFRGRGNSHIGSIKGMQQRQEDCPNRHTSSQLQVHSGCRTMGAGW